MALQRQTLSISISEGLDTKTDEKQVPMGKALALENARFQKSGKLSKRFGLIKKTVSTSANDLDTYTLNSVISDNEYVAAKSDSGIFGFSSAENRWQKQNSYAGGAKIRAEYVAKNIYDQTNSTQDTSSDGKFTAFCCAQTKGLERSILIVLQDNETGLKKYASYSNSGLFNTSKIICDYDNGVLKISLYFHELSLSPAYNRIFRTIYDVDLNVLVSKTSIQTAGNGWNVIKDATSQYLIAQSSTNLNCYSYTFGGTSITSSVLSGVATGIYETLSALIVGSTIHIAYPYLNGLYFIGVSKSTLLLSNAGVSKFTSPQPVRVSLTYNDANLCAVFDSTAAYVPSNTAYNLGVLLVNQSTYSTVIGYPIIYGRLQLCSDAYFINGQVNCIVTSPSTAGNDSFYIFDPISNIMTQVFSPTLGDTVSLYTTSRVTIIDDKVITALSRKKGISNNIGETFSTIGMASIVLRYGCNYKDNSRVKVDQRLYVNDGLLLELDKSNPHENGFAIKAEFKSIGVTIGTANPNIASKTFSYAITYEYYDSNGLITRSAPDYFTTLGATASNTQSINLSFYSPVGSLKYGTAYIKPITGVIYRTLNNGSVYYRIGEVVLTNKGYADGSYTDTASDADIADNETLYTTGGVLENNPAPPAEFCFSGGNRVFVGGLEEKDELAFSKKQLFGESVAFSDFFRIRVATGTSSDKTPISAGAYMDGKVIVFRGQSIYFCQGDGPSELGLGDFSSPEIISSDVGCYEPRSVLNFPEGVLFKSRKGIYLLGRDLSVSYIGAPVEDFNSHNVIASCLSEKYNEARFYLDNGECLVYNYLFQTWAVFKNQTEIDADNWAGMPIIVKDNAIWHETENIFTDDSSFYSMKFASPWLKLDLVQGYVRCYQLWIIGSYKSAHTLKCKVYVDYDSSSYEEYSLVYDNSSSPQYQFQISLPKQKVESIKFEIYDESQSGSGESYDLSNIQVEVGMKSGGYKLAANKSF